VFGEGEELRFDHLPVQRAAGEGAPADPADWLRARFALPLEGFSLETAINRFIQLALRQSNGNVSAAARLLGVSRDYVRYRLAGGKGSEGAGDPGAEHGAD